MTDWLFDLGNTRLKCAPLLAEGPGGIHVLPHREAEWPAALGAVLPGRIGVAHVASVASAQLRVALVEALAPRCERISMAVTVPRFGSLRIAYRDPTKLGVDRFLAMLGARERHPGPLLLCGIGTALTLDLVDADGLHLGGRIAPSPTLMREALHQRAPQLPAAGGAYMEFAADTADALASGCNGAAVALLEHGMRAAESRLGTPPRLVLHGGGVDALAPHLPGAIVSAAPVLDGLALWARAELAGEVDRRAGH